MSRPRFGMTRMSTVPAWPAKAVRNCAALVFVSVDRNRSQRVTFPARRAASSPAWST